MFAMECFFAHKAFSKGLLKFEISILEEIFGKFSPHYLIIPLYLPAIRKDLSVSIISIHTTAMTMI